MNRGCMACQAQVDDSIGAVDLPSQHRVYCAHDERRARRLDEAFGHALSSYTIKRCRACGLEQAEPALAPSADWYGVLYETSTLYPATRWEYEVVAERLGPDDRVVDYGCGSGHFMRTVRGSVREVIGFDFAPRCVAAAVQQGLEAHQLQAARPALARRMTADRRASHVTAFHVVEHLPSPRDLFDFASEVGADDATLWVAVPSDRRATRICGETDPMDQPPHHLTRWTRDALLRLGDRAGWRLAEFWYEPLSTRERVWEATRRRPLYHAVPPRLRPLQWAWRRVLALPVWLRGGAQMRDASGFSMLARFERARAS